MENKISPLPYSQRVKSVEELLDYFTARVGDNIRDPIVNEYYHSRLKKYKEEYKALTGKEYGEKNQ